MSDADDPRRATKRPAGFDIRVWVLGAVVVHLLAGLLLYEPALFPGGDNADYMILGESLRSGAGYRDLHLPAQPVHTKYPPVYPLLLGALGWLGGVQLFKLASLALTAATVGLAAVWGRRLIGAAPAVLVATALIALNPVLLEYSHYVLSEAPFTFLVAASLFLVADPDASPGRFAAGVAVAALAFLTRTAGLTVLVAIPAAAALSRRWRRAGWAGAAGLVVMAGWALFQAASDPGRAGYLQQLVLRDPYDPGAGALGPAGLVARAASNCWAYVSSVLPQAVTGTTGAGTGPAVLGVAVGGLGLGGWAARAGRQVEAPEVFAVLYVALIAVWPEVWTDRRFLLPLLPLLLLYASYGAYRLAGRLTTPAVGRPKVASARTTVVLGIALAVPAIGFIASRVPTRMACLAAYRAGAPCDPPALASLYEAARWAAANTAADAVFANRKPSLFYWHSRRRGDLYRFSGEPRLVLQSLDEMGADYVVVDQVSVTTFRYLVPAIEEYRDRFEGVYQGGEPPTLIFHYLGAPLTADAATPAGRAAAP